MNINIICVGKLKEKYWTEAAAEYSKRLSRFCTLQIEEVKEAKISDSPSKAEEDSVKAEEGKSILAKIKKDSYVVTLEIQGKALSSEAMAKWLDKLAVGGQSSITFVIGGSLGLSEEVSRRADLRLSFSDMTFPHQMMRIFLLEQIYRSFKINRNETYHK